MIRRLLTKARIDNQILIKKHKEQLRSIALIDGLTGIANRRKFDEELKTDWLQCARTQQPLSLLIIDVDFFKKYNDRFGHQKGDYCLQCVAKTIQQSVNRPYDLAARYGGEEFSCILPNTETEGAICIAANIISNISDLMIEHPDSSCAQIVTVSIGVATVIPQVEMPLTMLIEAADKQLYLSKQNGRACVFGTNL